MVGKNYVSRALKISSIYWEYTNNFNHYKINNLFKICKLLKYKYNIYFLLFN